MILASCLSEYIHPFIKKKSIISSEQDSFIFSDIYPQLDLTGILSICFAEDRTIWITDDGTLYAIGDNSEGKINGFLPKKLFNQPKKIYFEDETLQFSSVACGMYFSLYLTSSDNPQLIFVNSIVNEGKPNTFNLKPGEKVLSLFYNDFECGAILSTGSFIIIDQINHKIIYYSLPNNEKSIQLAFGDSNFVALSSTGKLYILNENKSNFIEVEELKDVKINYISGGDYCVLAVSNDGRVFVKGKNILGELGFPKEIKRIEKFTQIEAINSYFQVVNAYVSSHYSYFVLENGKMIYFGKANSYIKNSFLNKCQHFINCVPSETIVDKGCTFCITSDFLTIVFINCKPPPNNGNQRIGDTFPFISNKTNDETSYILRYSFLSQSQIYEQSKQISEIDDGCIRVFNYLTKKDNLKSCENVEDFLSLEEFEELIYHLTGEKIKSDDYCNTRSIDHIIQYAQNVSDFLDWQKNDDNKPYKQILYLLVLRDITIGNLLKKCNSILCKFNLLVHNFDEDFRDGKAFLALIHSVNSNDNNLVFDSNFSEENLKKIIIDSNIPYLLEKESLKNKDSCLIMFQVYAIIEHIKDDKKFNYDFFNDFDFYVYPDNYSPLLKVVNGICFKKFGYNYSKLENLIYGPDLLRFVNLLVKDPILDKIVTFPSTSVMKIEYSKKLIDFVIKYLRNKADKFKIYPFHFDQKTPEKEEYKNFNVDSSIKIFFRTLFDSYFIKTSEKEMFERCNIILGSKKQINSISDFKDGLVFVYLLRFLIHQEKNQVLNSVSFELIRDLFIKAKVVMIIDESILCSPENNRNYILYQLQFIFNSLDSSSLFENHFIEFLKEKIFRFKQMKVPDFHDMKNAILAKKYFLSLKDANIKNYEIYLEKRIQSIKYPKTYKERRKEYEIKSAVKDANKEEEDNIEEIKKGKDFWNPDDLNSNCENGIIYDTDQKYDSDYNEKYQSIINKIKSIKANEKPIKSEMNYTEEAILNFSFSWSVYDNCWNSSHYHADVVNYAGKNKRSPIVLFMNSDYNEVNKLISNTIKQKIDFKDYPSICGSFIFAPPFTNEYDEKSISQTSNKSDDNSDDSSSENTKNTIWPLFVFPYIPNKLKSYPKLVTALLQFYSCFINISQLVIIILKKDYVSYQLQMLKKILQIGEIFYQEMKTHNFPDFLFVINDKDFNTINQKSIDLFTKSQFVTKMKKEFKFQIHFSLINIDNLNSYNNFNDCLKEILTCRIRMIFERKIERSNISKLLFGDEKEEEKKKGIRKFFPKKKKDIMDDPNFNKLFEDAVKKDREELNKDSGYDNKNIPNTLLIMISIPKTLSGLYIRIKTNPEKFDIKSILIKRYKQLKNLLSSESDIINKIGEEISKYSLKSDEEFAKIASSTKFWISTGFTDLSFAIQSELKISSDQRLSFIESVLNEKLYWTSQQLSVMKNSHIRFLKKEFMDIIYLMNDKIVSYAFDKYGNIITEQIKNDTAKIDSLFEDFFKKIEKKKKTALIEMRNEMKKSSQYILKERENLKEIKIALEVNQKLEDVIPQDF